MAFRISALFLLLIIELPADELTSMLSCLRNNYFGLKVSNSCMDCMLTLSILLDADFESKYCHDPLIFFLAKAMDYER